jgi:DNA adenine methylase
MSKKNAKDETIKISVRLSKSKLEYLSKEYEASSITELLNKLIDDKLDNDFKSTETRSVITSIGAKNKVAKRIIDFMPEHKTYIELFGNTASILLKKERSLKEVYNDINGDVTNFFMVLRDNPIGLYNACSVLPYSQQFYDKLLKSPTPDDPLERAARFFYLNRASFLGNQFPGFRCDGKNRNFANFYINECKRFYSISKRMQGVEITNKDYSKLIKKNIDDPDTLFLADPPYYDGTDYYEHSFKLKDHIELATLLSKIKGKAMVCHCKNYQIHKLYTGLGFRYERIRSKYYSSIISTKSGQKVRPDSPLYLYLNY